MIQRFWFRKFRIALVGDYRDKPEINHKIKLVLSELKAHCADDQTVSEFIVSPMYTGEEFIKWAEDSKTPFCVYSTKTQSKNHNELNEGASEIYVEDTAFRSLIGEAVCNRIDAALTVWDEDVYELKGATWEFMSLAYNRKVPCIWISSKTFRVYCILNSYYEPYSSEKLSEMLTPLKDGPEIESAPEKPKRAVKYCMHLRKKYLAKHKRASAGIEYIEDPVMKEDFEPEPEAIEGEFARKKLLSMFNGFDTAAVSYNEYFQSIVYMRSILPFIATVLISVGFYANGLFGRIFAIFAPDYGKGILAVTSWAAGVGFILHAIVNLIVFNLSKSEGIERIRRGYIDNRFIAELLRILIHFSPYGISLDLNRFCAGDKKLACYIKHSLDDDKRRVYNIDQGSMRMAIRHIIELIDEQVSYHKISAARFKSISDSLSKWWKILFKTGFAVTILRGVFQGVLNYMDMGEYEGLYSTFANAVAFLVPAWAAYFSSKSTQNNYVYNYNNHELMISKLSVIRNRLDLLLKREQIPMEIVEVVISELSEIMLLEDTSQWRRQYMNTVIKPL
ncbi:MAG: hypothetical protein K5770_11780 [Lachnospiraceae bacterium]|nr:hypothetical protein [Lachnospiraceae bacterium]